MNPILMAPSDVAGLTTVELRQLVDQIGGTPLKPVILVIEGRARKVYLKLEGANPTDSVKDRTGYALVRDLEERGLLNKGSIVIESTSGNLGVALSMQCRARGYDFIAVVDPKTTQRTLPKCSRLVRRSIW
ncbi:MAG TPA: pyridoxal-phosphate dependent enzyme [Ktedonobacteraceae bacterium]|jgi:cysteine synthase|nr:pyridoxal-phosphate dependent enzyme [Ktedonobacteraceae bacterium]